MKAFRTLVAALVVGVLTVGSAQAGTVKAHLDGMNGKSVKIKIGSTSMTVMAGVFNWTRVGGTEAGMPTGQFHTVCIELDQYISFGGTYTYDLINVTDGPRPGLAVLGGSMSDTSAELLKKFWAAHYNEALTSNDKGAAFQIGVWDIVYDEGHGLFSGNFRANYTSLGTSPVFVQLAQTWLNDLANLTEMAPLMALSNLRNQDQLVLVPLPAAAWAGLSVLTVLAAVRKHRHKALSL
ncbi:MAG: hypothetical protein IT442_04540 [Phycisphaeraceae bacterium]|nr:hypothetical protein [Phycisphaeraceae bacterium]